MSVISDIAYLSPRIDEPLMMDEPDFLVGLNSKTKNEIKNTLTGLTQRQKLEMVTYAYMNVTHMRAGEDNEYAGLKPCIYNEMTLFAPNLIIDDIMDATVAKYKQAPERSGKTAQHLLDAILNVHMGRCGFLAIGSPKDNVAEVVTDGLASSLDRFKKHIIDTYKNVNTAFEEVFGKDMWGVDEFIHLDGASKIVESREDVPKNKKGAYKYYLTGRILNGGSIPVFSATSLQPVNMIYETLTKINHANYFILLDEADSIIKPSACGTTKMAMRIEQIIGMRSFTENVCAHGDQLGHPGTYGGAKIMFLSEYFNSLSGDRVVVRRPFGQRAQTLLGGVNDHSFVQINTNDIFGSLKTMLKSYFDSKNPLVPTRNFEYHLDNDYIIIDTMENVMTRPIKYWASKQPLIKLNSYLSPERKTNTIALVQGSPFVEGTGNKKNISDDDDTANQMRMIDEHFGKNSNRNFVPDNAVAVSYFSEGARIWFRDHRYGPRGVSVSTIIAVEALEDKLFSVKTDTEEKEARKIVEEFKNAAENISNAVKFISWFYGVHVPIVVFGFNKALRAIDCRDREHIITHQFIVVSDSHGADNEKQIAGRSKASKGEMMMLNFDVSNENDDENFKVMIASNVPLDDAATLENLPYQNELENGKRNVGADVKEAVRRKQVLSKAAKRYEPKANAMVVKDDEELLYDFNNDDDTYTLIIGDGSEFVFTADNVVEFDVAMMPGRTQILRCLQKAWMLEYFGLDVSSRTINKMMTAEKNTSITKLIKKGHFNTIGKDGNARVVKVSSDIQQFPTSV